MRLPELDDDTFIALLDLLEGIERRLPCPQGGLTYHQDTLLKQLAQTMRFELAAQKFEPQASLPEGTFSSTPPIPDEASLFEHWDSVLAEADVALRAYAVGLIYTTEVVNSMARLFYYTCSNQHRQTALPDLSVHVEPLFLREDPAVVVRLAPKTSIGRRYILSRQK